MSRGSATKDGKFKNAHADILFDLSLTDNILHPFPVRGGTFSNDCILTCDHKIFLPLRGGRRVNHKSKAPRVHNQFVHFRVARGTGSQQMCLPLRGWGYNLSKHRLNLSQQGEALDTVSKLIVFESHVLFMENVCPVLVLFAPPVLAAWLTFAVLIPSGAALMFTT